MQRKKKAANQVETQPHNMHTFLLKRNEKRGSSLDITYEKGDTSFSNNPFSFFHLFYSLVVHILRSMWQEEKVERIHMYICIGRAAIPFFSRREEEV